MYLTFLAGCFGLFFAQGGSMTDRELMQMALDALINAKGYIFHNVLDDKANQYDTAVEALRARLAQPEPEPLWIRNEEGKLELHSPPQREWQGLTEDEALALGKQYYHSPVSLMYAVEAKLKEKNS
jgi:hypothetical protein